MSGHKKTARSERPQVIFSKEYVAMLSEHLALLAGAAHKQGREAYRKLREAAAGGQGTNTT